MVEAIRLDPQYAIAYNNRGFAYDNLGQHERAIEDYDETIRLDPQYVKAYNNRGNAYYNLGQHELAAHIKQRSECTQVEKADIPFIAMPICTLGCDALYEAGWVSVDDGVVKTARTASPALSDVLGGLSGTKCTYWVAARESYFRWHRGNRFKERKSGFLMLKRVPLKRIEQIVDYKLPLAGLPKIRTLPAAYTSQDCSLCGHRERKNRVSQSGFRCVQCSYETHADLNGSHNFARRWIDRLAQRGKRTLTAA